MQPDMETEIEPEFKLDRIRRMSNIVQALENLILQCEDVDGFELLHVSAQSHLGEARRLMHKTIHSQ